MRNRRWNKPAPQQRRWDDTRLRAWWRNRDFPLLCYIVASLVLLALLLVETLP